MGGNGEHPLYFENYPCNKLPSILDDLYIIKFTFHFYELPYSLMYHRNRRDFSEFMLHHLVTIGLIVFSYSMNFIEVGIIIMLICDTTDIFVGLFKILDTITNMKTALPLYMAMLISWGYLRVYFYPVHVVMAVYYESKTKEHPVFPIITNFFLGFLFLLHILNVFWFYLIIKGGLGRMKPSKPYTEKSSKLEANPDKDIQTASLKKLQ